MKPSDLAISDFFPLVRQTLLDTYKVDALLIHPPYDNFEKLDLGLRKMVWGTYSTNAPIFTLSDSDTTYEVIVLESALGFYNVITSLDATENPSMLGIAPFRTEPITQAGVNKIMKENGVSPQHASTMYRFYQSLPIVDLDDFLLTLAHLITFFVPEFKDHQVNYVNYKQEQHEISPSEERFLQFTSDYISDLQTKLNNCCNAIISGNQAKALEEMKSVMDACVSSHARPLPRARHEISMLNTAIVSRLFETPIHPYYVFTQSSAFELRISEANSLNALHHLPFEMARKYAILAKNYTYEKYSYLIRNVINYIDQHLASDLTLSALAEEFDKNASYLSNTFKKEVGDTLTNYIGKQRIQTSLRYFNTTNMTVAEVAEAVGISDFGYFSKLFKKHVGVSPREYKKMLDK